MSVQTQFPNLNKVTVNSFEQCGCKFEFSKSIISPSQEIDDIQKENNLQCLPDIIYGKNQCKISHSNGFKMIFNAKDSLKYCNYEYLNQNYHDYEENGNTQNLNSINHIPGEIKIKFAEQWKKKDLSDIDVKEMEKISDSFYSTPYKGTISQCKLEKTDEDINVGNLSEKNPIKFSELMHLWEDELGDNGLTQLEFRVMADCYFGLLRQYIRVDDVIVRIFDTRIYHEFDKNYIIREFSVRENSYEELIQKGFQFTSEFTSDPNNQSFKIYNKLDIKKIVKEKIIIE